MPRDYSELHHRLGYFSSCIICSSSRAAAELSLDVTHCIVFNDISSD